MQSKKPPFFSLIIPHINEWYYLDAMLDSIAVHVQFHDYEIILVDDGSDDVTDLNFIENHPLREKIRIFHEKNLWSPWARNFWAKQAKGRYLFFLDAHMYFSEDSLERICTLLKHHKNIDFLQPIVGSYDGKRKNGAIYKIRDWILNSWWDKPSSTTTPLVDTPCVIWAAMVVKSHVFKKLEWFHPFFQKWWAEDIELPMRAWLSWYICKLATNVKIVHRFKDKFTNTEITNEHACLNKILMVYTCFHNRLVQVTILNSLKNHYWDMFENIYENVKKDKKFQSWRKKIQKTFVHDDAWYFRKFRAYYENYILFYPTTPITPKKESWNPLVSVIMPAYNSEKFIIPAIESILAQTYQDFEFIIIDDGSTDKTKDIIKRYKSKDKRIHIILNSQNQWVATIRNIWNKMARWKYIALADSDDISSPNRFHEMYNFLEKNSKYIAVSSGSYSTQSYGNIFSIYHPPADKDLATMLAQWCYYHNACMYLNIGFLYREKFVRVSDYDFWLNKLTEGSKLGNKTFPLVYTVYRKDSVSHIKCGSTNYFDKMAQYFYRERLEKWYDSYDLWEVPEDMK